MKEGGKENIGSHRENGTRCCSSHKRESQTFMKWGALNPTSMSADLKHMKIIENKLSKNPSQASLG